MDVYITWFSRNSGQQADPKFPAIVDTVMLALRFSQPNPAYLTDPATNLTSTVYNAGENMHYRIGIESTDDERWLRYDALIQCIDLGNHQRLDAESCASCLRRPGSPDLHGLHRHGDRQDAARRTGRGVRHHPGGPAGG